MSVIIRSFQRSTVRRVAVAPPPPFGNLFLHGSSADWNVIGSYILNHCEDEMGNKQIDSSEKDKKKNIFKQMCK